jgi:hypothetical protein
MLGVGPAWRVAGWRGLAVGAMAFGVQLYAVVVGGDFMTMGRLIVPGLAFAALLVGAATQAASERGLRTHQAAVLGAVVLAVVGALPLANVHIVPEDIRRDYRVRFNTASFRSEIEQWRFMKGNAAAWAKLGKALHQTEKPGESIVLGAIGAVGYHSDLYIYDRYGLVTRAVTEREVVDTGRKHSPGHDKYVAITFFLRDEPTYVRAKVFPQAQVGRAVREAEQWAGGGMLRRQYAPRVRPVTLDGAPYVVLTLVRTPADKIDRRWDAFEGRVADLKLPGAKGDVGDP